MSYHASQSARDVHSLMRMTLLATEPVRAAAIIVGEASEKRSRSSADVWGSREGKFHARKEALLLRTESLHRYPNVPYSSHPLLFALGQYRHEHLTEPVFRHLVGHLPRLLEFIGQSAF